MEISKQFKKLKETWREEITKDEWFFARFRENLLSELKPEESIDTINLVVNLIIHDDDNDYITELLEILLCIIRNVNTSEIPDTILTYLDTLKNITENDKYQKNIVDEIQTFYRLDSAK